MVRLQTGNSLQNGHPGFQFVSYEFHHVPYFDLVQLADALFLAAANASRANAPKSDIPVPVVRFIAEDDTGQQSCPTNRPRRRRQAVDTEPADRSGSEDAPVANNPREALAMGVWTEHRVWDHLPPYRPPSVSIGGDQRRSLTGMHLFSARL